MPAIKTSKFEIKTSALRSLIEICIGPPSYIVRGSNPNAKKILLDQVSEEDRAGLKRLLGASTQFLPATDTAIGNARSFVNQFKKDIIAGDNKRGYRGLAKTGRPNTYLCRVQDFDRFEEIFRSYKPRIDKCNDRIRDQWESLKERGKEEMLVFGEGYEYPTIDKFLRKSELTFEVETTISDSKIFDTVLAETVQRIRAKAEESAKNKVLAAHAKPAEALLSALGVCIERLLAAGGKTESGQNKRLRPEKFRAVEKLVAEVRCKNFLDLPELETAASTAASLVEGLDVVGLDPAERKEKAEEFTKVTSAIEDKLAASGLA